MIIIDYSCDNESYDRQYYESTEQPDDYFHPSTSGEQYQSDEYQNGNESK